jgi:hypothetical protein
LTAFITREFTGGRRVYRFHHKSIADWFATPPPEADRFKIDPAPSRARLLVHCRGWATHHEAYALRYLVTHLVEAGLLGEARALIRDGFFAARDGVVHDRRLDLEDSSALTLALVRTGDAAGILELARTANNWQRDGVAAALQNAPRAADGFVDTVVAQLLSVAA